MSNKIEHILHPLDVKLLDHIGLHKYLLMIGYKLTDVDGVYNTHDGHKPVYGKPTYNNGIINVTLGYEVEDVLFGKTRNELKKVFDTLQPRCFQYNVETLETKAYTCEVDDLYKYMSTGDTHNYPRPCVWLEPNSDIIVIVKYAVLKETFMEVIEAILDHNKRYNSYPKITRS